MKKLAKQETRGRKSKLTPELHNAFIKLCEWMNVQDALDVMKIPKGTYDKWIERGKRDEDHDPRYCEFYEDMQKAKAKRRSRCLKPIFKAADYGDWRAGAWLAERLMRDEFGQRSEVDVKTEETIQYVLILPDDHSGDNLDKVYRDRAFAGPANKLLGEPSED